jgi:chromate transporter
MLLKLALYFLRLGVIGFGGPPAHIAIMRNDLVEKLKWVTPEQFDADLATANLLPGPTSTEMTIYIGHRLHGVMGAIVAGICFILPAFSIMLALAVAYVSLGSVQQFDDLLYGIKPVALALIIAGTVQLGRPALLGWREWLLLGISLVAILLAPLQVLLIFILAGVALLALTRVAQGQAALHAIVFSTPAWPFLQQVAAANLALLADVFYTFLKIGALIYGGGFALVGILQQEIVNGKAWLTPQQLLDGIAFGQATPGPVFTTATFVGYLVAGLPGATLATVGIFAPAFLFVVLENRLLGSIKQNEAVKVFLRGVNVAVVASIAIAAAQLSRDALIDVPTTIIAIVSLIALMRFRIDAHWLIGAGLLIGVIRSLLS